MKGEYVDSQNGNPNNMFSKLHHSFSHHFHPSHYDSKDPSTLPTGGTTASDGASIEVVRRPRGRPPGSKNKPKQSLLVAREPNEPAMNPYVLEIPGGNDVVEAISGFCRRKNVGVCVLNGSGTVSNVTLRQLSSTPGATITFHGRFDILSLSATVLPPTTSYNVPNTFSISLAGPQGQVVGGFVAGSLMAADTAFIVAATFNNPSYHNLAADVGGGEEETRNTMLSGGDGEEQSPPFSGGGGDSTGHGGGGSESCGVSMYNRQFGGGSDGIWAPTARLPRPPY
ncbi:AT-hook motif nuclear-localized protein 17 [Hibiscus syriacus]|uniref:AT-hook motif nuclear-localized protein n=1 Tax=Hibiscus syriacus TaxID=106335 RepID=A0A6A3CAX8_HIBSY|nr:AT-hook motif nuclear-localized protein 28-like [Hibiscus syriacus]KAE8725001.1 AT-hook motif nuclear-localized protein 17 [Hibiscus syriacus]